jgi:hypothetical protein
MGKFAGVFLLSTFTLGLGSSNALIAESFEIIVPKSRSLLGISRLAPRPMLEADEVKSTESVELLKFENREDYERALRTLQSSGIAAEANANFSADLVNENIEFDLNRFDEFLGNQWSLLNRGSIQSSTLAGGDIDVLRAWTFTEGRGRLYVVDSGIDQRNEDLAGRVVDAFSAIEGKGPEDENGHGTHVSSIAAAGRNAVGIMGVAPGDVEIVSVRMLDRANSGNTFTAVRAYELIRQDVEDYLREDPEHFVVISNSWGGEQFSQSLQNAMRAVAGDRVLFVTSAGNDSNNNDERPYYPCNFNLANNLCVAATDRSDALTNFSSYGANSVHVMAPGFQILGATPSLVQGNQVLSTWGEKSGTSQATPHVSGAALLVWATNPELSAADVKAILLEGVDRIPGAEDFVLSGGRLNVYRSVLMATGRDPGLADRGFGQVNRASSKSGGCQLYSRSQGHTESPLVGVVAILMAVSLVILVIRQGSRKI